MKETFFTRTRLIIILSIILVFSFTLTSIISYNVTRNVVAQSSKSEVLPLISNNIYSEIQQVLINPINNSSVMVNDEFLIDWVLSGEKNPDEVIRYLKRIKEKYNYFSSFFVSENTGNYYYYDGILKKISTSDSHDVWYYDFVKKNIPFALDVDKDEATAGTITVFINHRLEDSAGNLLGVTGIGLKMESIGQTLKDYQEKYGHLIYMVDSTGLVQVHTDINVIEKLNIRDMPGVGNLTEKILSSKQGTNIYEYKDVKRDMIISSRYFPDLDWFLIVEADQKLSLQLARNYLIGNIIIGIIVTSLVILLVALTVNLFHSKIEAMAIIDDLTGLYNRRKIQEVFHREIMYARRYNQPLSVMMIDIDSFKSINDLYGHLAGDEYLKLLSDILRKGIREIDSIGRWGGEEFIVILPNTDTAHAMHAAERLVRLASAAESQTGKGAISRTISIGVSTSVSGKLEMDEMTALADEALYRAKAEGRDRAYASINKIV
jgi:diguanylate cyclase (GGDEF)-like protein